MALIARALGFGALIGSGLLGCRHFEICDPKQRCISESSISDAASADASDVDPRACSRTKYDCDETRTNGCETDISTDPEHCGGCDKPCDGLCAAFTCVPFHSVDGERETQGASLLVTAEYVYSVTRPWISDDAYDLRRAARADDRSTTLAERAWREVNVLAASASRLYVAADGDAFSLPTAGGELRLEQSQVDGLASVGSYVAFLSGSELRLRHGDTGEFTAVPNLSEVSEIHGGQRTLFGDSPDGFFSYDPVSTTLELAPHGGLFVLGMGPIDDAEATDPALFYFVAEGEDGNPVLYQMTSDTPPVALLDLSYVTSWAITTIFAGPFLGTPCIVATYEHGRTKGLWLAALNDPQSRLTWRSRGELDGLTLPPDPGATPAPDAWLFDGYQRALVRLSLDELLRVQFADDN